jgi:hypothetical protein
LLKNEIGQTGLRMVAAGGRTAVIMRLTVDAIVENVMGTVRRVCRNVKRWRSASMALRNRAGDVIGRIRAIVKKVPPRHDQLDINRPPPRWPVHVFTQPRPISVIVPALQQVPQRLMGGIPADRVGRHRTGIRFSGRLPQPAGR